MISFDSINYQWEEKDGKRTLIVFIDDVPHLDLEAKKISEKYLSNEIKGLFNK